MKRTLVALGLLAATALAAPSLEPAAQAEPANAPLAQAHSVHLTTGLERGVVAEVDGGVLRQVLLNLTGNAIIEVLVI